MAEKQKARVVSPLGGSIRHLATSQVLTQNAYNNFSSLQQLVKFTKQNDSKALQCNKWNFFYLENSLTYKKSLLSLQEPLMCYNLLLLEVCYNMYHANKGM